MNKHDKILQNPKDYIMSMRDELGYSADDMELSYAWEGLVESCIDLLPEDLYQQVRGCSEEMQAVAGLAYAGEDLELLDRVVNMK